MNRIISLFVFSLLLGAAAAQQPTNTPSIDVKKVAKAIIEIRLDAEKGDSEAVKWFRKAAEQNNVESQYNLGLCYASGEGVTKDYVEAIKWYRKAAEQNYPSAQHGLGVCYASGYGVEQNYAEAVQWYRKPAKQNHAASQLNLGICYIDGKGVAKDLVQGYKWASLAAVQGNENAKRGIP